MAPSRFRRIYDRNPALLRGRTAPGGTSINFSGYYVYATWYLTGESRAEAYISYPEEFNSPANFRQIKILNPARGRLRRLGARCTVQQINLNDGSVGFAEPGGFRPNIQPRGNPPFCLAPSSAGWAGLGISPQDLGQHGGGPADHGRFLGRHLQGSLWQARGRAAIFLHQKFGFAGIGGTPERMKTPSSPAFPTIRSNRETAAPARRARWRNGPRAAIW